MKWTTVCGVLSLLFAIDCAGVKGHYCPQAPGSLRTGTENLNINELREVRKSSTAGGMGGDKWTDPVESYELSHIQSITIWHAAKVEGIEVVYTRSNGGTYNAPLRGSKDGFSMDKVSLDSDHTIIRIQGHTDWNYVGTISFIVQSKSTGENTTYGPYGTETGNWEYSLDGIILGFHGRAGEKLDALGAYYLSLGEKSPRFGGDGGDPWEDPVNTNSPAVVGIKRIAIKYGTSIDSIQVDYHLLWDGTLYGDRHGGEGGSMASIDFQEGERLIEVRTSFAGGLNQVKFITRKTDGTRAEYGPYGEEGKDDTKMSFFGDIVGFWGSAGSIMDSLGVYYTSC